jgi:hypothetical protein
LSATSAVRASRLAGSGETGFVLESELQAKPNESAIPIPIIKSHLFITDLLSVALPSGLTQSRSRVEAVG